MKTSVSLTVNGDRQDIEVEPMRRLLDVLRDDLGLTGTKEGCGEGECGACSIFLDGKLVNSCLIPVLDAHECDITTIEGVGGPLVHRLQQALINEGGAQCGICTPGMLLAAVDLLGKHPRPTLSQIREGLAGNLCRCTGYMRIFAAVEEASSIT